MKKRHLFLSWLVIGLLVGCNQPSGDHSANNAADSTAAAQQGTDTTQMAYGKVKVDTAGALTTAQLVANFKGKTAMEATFKGKINEVCAKEGCWIRVKNGKQDPVMVRFKNHFTIPKDTPMGSTAYLTGKAIQDTVSVERQKHFLEDAKASKEEIAAITQPKYTMTFIADGIQLVK